MRKWMAAALATAMFLSLCVSVSAEEKAYEYTEEVLFLPAGDHEIPATLTLPIGAEGEKFPAVVMLHGNGSNRYEAGNGYDYAAPEMAKAGIVTIRFDYLGNGDSKGDYIDFTYDVALSDAMACYAHLATLDAVDPARVGIMGWSMGGRLSLIAASRQEEFKSVCTWAGAAFTGDLDEEYATAKAQGFYEVTYSWRGPLRQSPAYYEIAMAIDYGQVIASIKAPILAINGALDTVVLPEVSEYIVATSTNPASELYLLEGADHTFNVFTGDLGALENITDKTIDWFLNTL